MTTKRTVVGAHYGLRDWLAQRVTAVIMAVYTIVLLVAVLALPELTYGNWAGLFASAWMKIATLLVVIALIYHAWVGVRDIYMDYLPSAALRLVLQVLTIAVLIGYACWAAIILWRV
ncbi:MAG: succinate dehydrogenase, hydrophobic membrane anchor protein [Burkholderiaceae bacterium]